MEYAELHCVSHFTFLRGASDPRELVHQAHALGYRALALTDECSYAGIVRAYEASKDTGLALIIGAEFQLVDGPKLVALAPDFDGYSEISALISRARRRADKGHYTIARRDFEQHCAKALLLWSPRWPSRGTAIEAESIAPWLRDGFAGRAWIAWERTVHREDAARLAYLREVGARFALPLLAAGDVHLHDKARGELQDVLTCVRHGCTLEQAGERLYPNHERYLRDRRRLSRLYPADLLDQTVRVAERCTFRMEQLRYEYPHELVPPGLTATQHLRALTEDGIRRRWPDGCTPAVRAIIEKELRLVEEVKYEHYFLTVADIVTFARSVGILCQGRGSAANSAVCYALGVTEVDPARMNMLFERFISKERNEPPDIDIDFEHQRREEVIQYLYTKYGRRRAAIAATVITYRRRSATRDIGKALGMSLDQIDALIQGLTLWADSAEAGERMKQMGFDLASPTIQNLMRLVDEVLGFPRHLSQHVGGFVISHRPLHELVPVENASMPDRTIIQWDKDDLDTMGLLKVDVLALGMLSAIRRACAMVQGFRGRPFTFGDIPSEDAKTYAMIGRAETVGVFQVESRAQMTMLPRLRPQCFYDLVIEVAIIRPGPIQGGMVHPYLRRRQGLETVTYPSADLQRVLQRTLGVPLFQEQVMEICMVAAGFSAGEADQVRRSMAAWRRKGGLEAYRDRLLGGMAERGYTNAFAESIYQQILGFSGYGFPESHAASFALITYASCWLKCNEPAAFVAGLLNSQPMGFYAPAQLVNDARRAGVRFRAIDVAESDWDCTLEAGDEGDPEVRLGLRLIVGMVEDAARRLEAVRREAPFASVADLAHRARLDRRAMNLLADAGALRRLTAHRHEARWDAVGVEYLRGLLAGHSAAEPAADLPAPTEAQEVAADYRSAALTLGRHPLAFLRERLAKKRVLAAEQLKTQRDGRQVQVAGLVTHRQRPSTASGVIFATLEDETGTSNLIIWPGVAEQFRQQTLMAQLMLVSGKLQSEQGVIHVVVESITDLTAWLGALPSSSRDFR